MKKRLLEESVLLGRILKRSVLSANASVIVGVATTMSLKLLSRRIVSAGNYALSILFLPAALFLSSLIVLCTATES